jgi:hypothetical protein
MTRRDCLLMDTFACKYRIGHPTSTEFPDWKSFLRYRLLMQEKKNILSVHVIITPLRMYHRGMRRTNMHRSVDYVQQI